MLLDATQARLQLADENAMADDGGVVFDHGPTQPDDLLPGLLVLCRLPSVHRQQVGGNIGAQRMEVALQLRTHVAHFRTHVAKQLQDQVVGLGVHERNGSPMVSLDATGETPPALADVAMTGCIGRDLDRLAGQESRRRRVLRPLPRCLHPRLVNGGANAFRTTSVLPSNSTVSI